MFKQSEIGAKCTCDCPETICHTLGFKHYRLPAGTYGGYYEKAHYYMAEWWELLCEQCGNRRQDFIVWRWCSDGDMWPVVTFQPEKREAHYGAIKSAIRAQMKK